MDEPANYRERLAGLLGEIAVEEGLQPTRIEGVHVFKGSKSVPRAPMVYRPHIIIVGQGRKRAYLGGETYQYDPANYLVLAVPLPAECDAETEDGQAHPHGQHRRRHDDGRRDAPRNRRFVAPLGRDAARHLLDADEPRSWPGRSSGSSNASSARSTAAYSAARWCGRSSIACSGASKAGHSTRWRAATTISRGLPAS